MYTITLDHSIDCAHRVVGHQGGKGKCARLHGHTYLYTVEVSGNVLIPDLGYLIDFGDIKDVLNRWDHRTLLWDKDPLKYALHSEGWSESVVELPANPTAENLAKFAALDIMETFAPTQEGEYCQVGIVVYETPKSKAEFAVASDNGEVYAL